INFNDMFLPDFESDNLLGISFIQPVALLTIPPGSNLIIKAIRANDDYSDVNLPPPQSTIAATFDRRTIYSASPNHLTSGVSSITLSYNTALKYEVYVFNSSTSVNEYGSLLYIINDII